MENFYGETNYNGYVGKFANRSEEFNRAYDELRIKDEKIKLLDKMLNTAGNNEMIVQFVENQVADVVNAYLTKLAVVSERADIYNSVMNMISSKGYTYEGIGISTAEITTENGIFVVKVSTSREHYREKMERQNRCNAENGKVRVNKTANHQAYPVTDENNGW